MARDLLRKRDGAHSRGVAAWETIATRPRPSA